MISECTWRPARWATTEFVRPYTPAVLDQAASFRKMVTTDDDYIRVCANFIKNDFVYPLEKNGDPSAGLLFKRYDKGCFPKKYFFNQEMDYAWGFPQETMKLGKGICIDTALLMTSLLIAGGVPAKCVLGQIVSVKTGEVVGYHAWSEFMYQGELCVCETTIHFDAETITRVASIYNQHSDWAQLNGIYYNKQSAFDDREYEAVGMLGAEMVSLMGLTPQRVECFGLMETLERMDKKRKSMAKEWRKAETIKHNILSQAYGG